MKVGDLKYQVKRSLLYGLIYSAIGVVLWFIIYAININWFFAPFYYVIHILIFFTYFHFVGKDFRKKAGIKLTFGHAFLIAWITMIVYGIILFIVYVLMLKVIDSDLTNELARGTVNTTKELAALIGYDREKLNRADEKLMEKAMEEFTTMNLLKNYLIVNGVYFLGSLVAALMIKRK